jgi:glucokinase-like ROK family protein
MKLANEIGIASTHLEALSFNPLELGVIQAVRQNGYLSRTDLSERLKYSRASLTPIFTRLVSLGILTEVGQGKSGGGRPPIMLGINGSLGYAAGVDIGATSIDIALADFTGQILERCSEQADVRIGPKQLLSRVKENLIKLLSKRGAGQDRLLAIGIGVPGPVEFATGLLIAPPLMPTWEGFPIKEEMRRSYHVASIVVDNDVNIMAKGEQKMGAGIGLDNFMFIKIGTGIGCGIISAGEVYRGSDGCAGDIGHICVDAEGPVCHCGNRGCLEFVSAGAAIAQKAVTGVQEGKSQFLADRIKAKDGVLTAKDVGEAAAAGDRLANEIVRESGKLIGGVLAGLVNFYNPRAIFIGGGVSNIGNQLLAAIRHTILSRATALSTIKLRVEYSELGESAGVHGAIHMALENVFIKTN